MLTESEPTLTDDSQPPSPADDDAAPDVGLRLESLVRRFGSVKAVDGISLTVEPGALVSFLGPSGCGKTTLLRLIAGLDSPSQGRIVLDGKDLTGVSAHQRDIGMVFQSLALFPHLTVARNIGYSLKIRGADKAAIAGRVDELLRMVGLEGLGDRKVSQLSGGQRQRVAIARALAREPALFLLDEPMSALDANLRESLQVELRMLQQQLGITTIMVTHDQREAMTMSDVIVLLNNGRIEQAGPPSEVYHHPATAFAAQFLGSTNLLRGTRRSSSSADILGNAFELSAEEEGTRPDTPVVLSARPADIVIEPALVEGADLGPNRLTGTLSFVRDLGATVECFVDIGADEPVTVQGLARDLPVLAQGDEVVLYVPASNCKVVADSPELAELDEDAADG